MHDSELVMEIELMGAMQKVVGAYQLVPKTSAKVKEN